MLRFEREPASLRAKKKVMPKVTPKAMHNENFLKIITAEETRPLRQKVLRPHEPVESLTYPGDHAPDAVHFGFQDQAGVIVGIASLYRESLPDRVGTGWRLRGMAAATHCQGMGVGTRLLNRCHEHITGAGGTYLWCNARKSALGFYEKNLFHVISDEFDIAGIGPHFVMKRDL
jgi:GNAT superfamily N-acetyltransferase